MGFSSNQFDISSLNSCVMSHSDYTYVLLDSSKFDRCSLVSYSPLESVGAIVTNAAPSEALIASLAANDIQIHIANE